MNFQKLISLGVLSAIAFSNVAFTVNSVYIAPNAPIYDSSIGEWYENEIIISPEDDLSMIIEPDLSILSNFSEGSYNHYDSLDSTNKIVYNALKDVVLIPSKDFHTIPLSTPIEIEFDEKPDLNKAEDLEKVQNTITPNIWPACVMLMLDYPEAFWTTGGISYGFSYTTSSSNKKYQLKVTNVQVQFILNETSYPTVDDALAMKTILNERIDDFIVEGDTTYEKVKSIHDQIVDMNDYVLDANNAHNIVGTFIDGEAVCESYSEAFKIICDRENIPNVLILGNFDEDGVGHMWNYVKMDDGEWYGVDVTWADQDTWTSYNYFLKGSDSFFTSHFEDNILQGVTYVYPEISVDDYDPNAVVTTTTSEPTTSTTTTAKPTTTTTTSEPTTSTTTTTTTAKPTTSTTTTTTTAKPTTSTTTTTTTAKPTTSTTTTTTTAKPTTSTTTTTTTAKPTITTTTTTTTTTEPVTEAPILLKGDVNLDGIVNSDDLIVLSNAILNSTMKSSYNYDINNDNTINSFDLISLKLIIME